MPDLSRESSRFRPVVTNVPAEHASMKGTIAFVVGAGGKLTRGNLEPAAFSEGLITGTTGVPKLIFTDKAASRTYLTGPGSTETDSGTVQC